RKAKRSSCGTCPVTVMSAFSKMLINLSSTGQTHASMLLLDLVSTAVWVIAWPRCSCECSGKKFPVDSARWNWLVTWFAYLITSSVALKMCQCACMRG
ncbi:uncharacterized protein METZ01_LOCUS266282, partial [marine metagenome]